MIFIDLEKTLEGAAGPIHLEFNVELNAGRIMALYGPSGSGKTSILRMIAGLMCPDRGLIQLENVMWLDTSHCVELSPRYRDVGVAFQDYALFPNMTVKEHLEYALGKNQDSNIVSELVDVMELNHLISSYPATLSGGQKQRVSLARSLVQRPKVLLLDEPLSALDRHMRTKLQGYICEVQKTYDLIVIIVSHDVSEIFKMCDHVVTIDEGKIVKSGPPQEVFASKEVSGKFQFTGEVLFIEEQGFLIIVSILVGHDFVKVIADQQEVESLKIGDRVLVASKAFNPIIKVIA